MGEFVEGWKIINTLGEGAYGEVKLLVNPTTGSAVAMKVVDLNKHPTAKPDICKEILIHSMATNKNIIKYYGKRQDDNLIYIFLEYAEGGELFDRIEPDVGMPECYAQRYFLQLMAGLDFLHKKGIAHRDLKPENLLIDSRNNLKITDFGMATFFRIRNQERPMNKKCGTIPYIAPEVFVGPYHAEPADIWSCGIILIALLSGALPWDMAVPDCPTYVKFPTDQCPQTSPWTKINPVAFSLVRSILAHIPMERASIASILSHKWCSMKFTANERKFDYNYDAITGEQKCVSYSQPQEVPYHEVLNYDTDPSKTHFFSQPTQIDNLLLSTPLRASQDAISVCEDAISNLIFRMTRFCVQLNVNKALERLIVVLENLGYTMKSITNNMVTVTTIDKTKSALIFKISLYSMNCKTLLDFRLSKGCGIEFKRRFIRLRREFLDIIVTD